MKNLNTMLIRFIAVVLLAMSAPQAMADVSIPELEYRDHKYYVKGEAEPYTGVYEEFFDKDKKEKRKKTNFKNGLVSGEFITWNRKGDIFLQASVKQGKLELPLKAYDRSEFKFDGKCSSDSCRLKILKGDSSFTVAEIDYPVIHPLENGIEILVPEGISRATEYSANGVKQTETTYKVLRTDRGMRAEEHGKITAWYENGQIKTQGTYRDGKRNGKWVEWHENGQKAEEGRYKSGNTDGKWISWHENGQKAEEGRYKSGNTDGKWIGWHENGQVRIQGTWKNALPTGLMEGWHDNGSKSIMDHYQETTGKLKRWWQNDNMKLTGYAALTGEGQKMEWMFNGHFTRWHDNGKKMEEGDYRLGKKIGKWIKWDKNGALISETHHTSKD